MDLTNLAPLLPLIVGVVAGSVLGGLIVWLIQRAQSSGLRERVAHFTNMQQNVDLMTERTASLQRENGELQIHVAKLQEKANADAEKIEWLSSAKQQMQDTFNSLAGQSLQTNTDEFMKRAEGQLISPLKQNLLSLDGHIRDMEQKREGAYKGLEEQLRSLAATHVVLHDTTSNLVGALKSPTVRGNWGELQLRRVVELAGLSNHVDFEEQVHTKNGRPDLVVYMPNDVFLPVDAKTPMEAYLQAMEAKTEEERRRKLIGHAQAMRARAKELSQKQYWSQFESAPEFVVMFIPNDACLHAAFEQDKELLDYCLNSKVLIATPVTLLALLKSVAHGWQQRRLTENSQEIVKEGRELYSRLAKFVDHLSSVGVNLGRTLNSYNDAIGSLERRLLPSARRFQELQVTLDALPTPVRLDDPVRRMDVLGIDDEQ
jgi:DNA recombination protein RmuC